MYLCTTETVMLESMAPNCICFSGIEPDCTEVPDQMLIGPAHKEWNRDYLSRFVDAGVVLSGNCIPYLTGFIPLMGEHFVSCESSATLFMNSVWGTRGNGDGIEASFCAAVCGRIPRAGKHLSVNRIGTDIVNIKIKPSSIHDWGLLGYAIGRKLPAYSVPVLMGDFLRPNSIHFKSFAASLATSAGTEMCHIVGVTPEAMTLEQSLNNRKPDNEFEISTYDMTTAIEVLNGHGRQKIDYISLGCPHYHIEEIRHIAAFLEGKKIHPDTVVHIWTAGSIKYMADRSGYWEGR